MITIEDSKWFLCYKWHDKITDAIKEARNIPRNDFVNIIPVTTGRLFKKQHYVLLFYRWVDERDN